MLGISRQSLQYRLKNGRSASIRNQNDLLSLSSLKRIS
ncbi:hypothetical protein PO124_30410 [Bacillus licheniformis]|nr:hypothetical protein [Bacillus licheniformis]